MKVKFKEILAAENFNLTEDQLDKFVTYSNLLKEWNKKMNLTALETDEEIIYKHFLDSLFCLKLDLNWQEKKILDVGTGAGFPGLPLKIYLDSVEVHLLDSLKKRVLFLEEVIKNLNLKNVFCFHGRAEDFGKNDAFREQYDLVTARAVARLPVLLELCLPFVKKDGFIIALKGPEGINELEESKEALSLLGGKVHTLKHFIIQGIRQERVLIAFQKTSPTPSKYPRKAGIPQKRPLT
ncbi:MAG: 16S rRNA (guanine(527)-N(7))-methyltransferase RsmG [Clostridia bacterium]|nr:16S rRNA (guanine(527)-N(7))-methyltransferase RsmG [Clostridia bacterium]